MRNWIIILAIFLIPMGLYGYLEAKEQTQMFCSIKPNQGVVNPKGKIIKFSSPMCSECQEIAPNIKKALENYKDSIIFEEINVLNSSKDDSYTKKAIKEFKVTLVPTTVFIDKNGKVIKRQEGVMSQAEIEQIFKTMTGN